MCTEVLEDVKVERRSLDEDSWAEACAERWYRSQEAGYDKGEEVIRQWVCRHWRGFLRARWVEHMQGARFWMELDRAEFGMLKKDDLANAGPLLEEIVDLLRQGAENLDIVRWSRRTKCPTDQATVKELLTRININAHRLPCKFYAD